MNPWMIILGICYLAMLVAVGIGSWKKTKSAEDYILAGSKVGLVVGMLTFAATLFSTFTLMGMPDFFRTHGVGAWIFLAVSDAVMFFFILWFGTQLRRRARSLNYQGMAGMLTTCYETRWAGWVYFAAAFCFLVPYVAIQIRGISSFFHAALPDFLPAWGWSIAIVCIMLAYSEVGGLRAIILCDSIQALILLLALWIIAYGCLRSLGGVSAMFAQVKEANEALLSIPGPKGLLNRQFLIASFVAILYFPVTQPQVATRLVIMKSRKTMQHMTFSLSIFTMLVLLPTIAIGFYGSVNYQDAAPDVFWAQVLLHEQADIIAALVMIGLLAAATSTADSQLFALGTELRSMLRVTDVSSVKYTRIAVLCFGMASLAFSIIASDQLVLLARVSFAGTAMAGPMILSAVVLSRPPSKIIVGASLIGLVLFILSLLKIIPDHVGPVRMDLGLIVVLTVIAVLANLLKRHRVGAS
jgi:solute:Na+ symporter, SSS family